MRCQQDLHPWEVMWAWWLPPSDAGKAGSSSGHICVLVLSPGPGAGWPSPWRSTAGAVRELSKPQTGLGGGGESCGQRCPGLGYPGFGTQRPSSLEPLWGGGKVRDEGDGPEDWLPGGSDGNRHGLGTTVCFLCQIVPSPALRAVGDNGSTVWDSAVTDGGQSQGWSPDL